MPISLKNSRDIAANSDSIIDTNGINNILDIISGIVGSAPSSSNSLGKLANAIDKDPQLYDALVAMNCHRVSNHWNLSSPGH